MSEHPTSREITSSNQKAQEELLKVVDVIMEVGKRVYEKGAEAIKFKEKDCSNSVELQTHPVKFGYYHTSIRITPKSEEFKNDPRFKQVDEEGRHYTTLGAGPSYNTLTADVDRPNDIGPHPYRIPLGLKNCENESIIIEHVLDKFNNFKNRSDYDVFPANYKESAWYWPDDGHNSNSFISGLIDASHMDKPSIDVAIHPGWNKPVPIEYFRIYQNVDSLPKGFGLLAADEHAEESLEKTLFDELYRKDNGSIRKKEPLDDLYVGGSMDVCEGLSLNDLLTNYTKCKNLKIESQLPKLYDDYKRRIALKKIVKECGNGKSSDFVECLEQKSFNTPEEDAALESKRSEAIKDVFKKIDDFKKTDAFKFMENQVDGFKNIFPKL